MINSISIDNFRSLCNINDIEIKPMTVLLGKNSCGKSSFLRIFPLLKQSINTKTRGAISLFGELVDFGEFKTVLNDLYGKKKKYLTFGFSGIIPETTSSYMVRHGRRRIKSRRIDYSLSMKIRNYEEEDYLYISDIELKYDNNLIEISLNIKTKKLTKFLINGNSFLEKYPKLRLGYFTSTSLFPEFVLQYNKESFYGNPDIEIITNLITKNFKTIFTDYQIISVIHELDYTDGKEELIKKLQDNIEDNVKKIKLEEKLNKRPEIFDEIEAGLKLRDFLIIYDLLCDTLCREFLNICYSKPLRANTERFYRNQPLSVNEVEPDGSNLVQYYSTMTKNQKIDFHTWMDENFGFHYEVEKQTGFQSIIIKDSITKEIHNINDMGFGFTQILPIVTQEWSLISKQNRVFRQRDNIFVIEQPELHLHPAFQCKLIKAFVNSIKIAEERQLSIRFIIETHSETIVNYLGKIIERKQLLPEDVSVLIFKKDKSITEISKSSYDDNGVLNNWPIGFFGE